MVWPCPYSGALAQNRYARYAGKTVVIRVPVHPPGDAMSKGLAEFTKKQHQSRSEQVGHWPPGKKQLLEMAQAQGDCDLDCCIVMWKTEHVSEGLVFFYMVVNLSFTKVLLPLMAPRLAAASRFITDMGVDWGRSSASASASPSAWAA